VIETELVAFLRPEEKFVGLEALTAQVMDDAPAPGRCCCRSCREAGRPIC
jgi:hypothetical protein